MNISSCGINCEAGKFKAEQNCTQAVIHIKNIHFGEHVIFMYVPQSKDLPH